MVTYDEIPKVLLDSTIAVEDRTFWENEGYDPNAIASAMLENLTGASDRGASTITQQLVRARLLPEDVIEGDQTIRKIKEILQAKNLTTEFAGEPGKQRIITAYLNQIYYGHQAYGVAAAAQVYFGITDLKLLTPAQAALLAGMPQAPDSYDLYKWAQPDQFGRLVVPTESVNGEALPPPVVRRNFILTALEEGHGHFIRLTPEQLDQALHEPIYLTPPAPSQMKAAAVRLLHEEPARRHPCGPRTCRTRRLQDHHDPRHERAGTGREIRRCRHDPAQRDDRQDGS